ncbi:hypothetical protein ACFYON_18560 [Micromonospora sp. NPDC005686]|uniref:hypothetical protein n=1 Tax=unclassified Micromonospora TaxID=2617518 RepID=UPI0033BC8178
MSLIPPQKLAQERVVSADAIVGGRVDLRLYPHRHLVIACATSWGRKSFQPLMEAIEHLSNYGWELINITSVGESSILYAAMRRTA